MRHHLIGLGEIGGGAADAFAGAGESIDHLLDAAAEIAGEKQPAGMVQPRFGLAPELVDGDRVGFDQRGANGFGGAGEIPDGAVADQIGQGRVAVAAGDAVNRGDDAGEPAFGEGADQRRADDAGHDSRQDADLQACGDCHADEEGRRRNPQRWSRD